MANKAVTLIRRCKTERGWRRYPASLGKNGRVRPGYVDIEGAQRYYETGTYEVRFYDGSRLVYQPVGDLATEALAARDRIWRKFAVRAVAKESGIEVVEAPSRIALAPKLDEMVRDALERGAEEAAAMNRRIVGEFMAITRRSYADEITRDDIFAWHRALVKKGNADRTIAVKHARLLAFYRYAGLDRSVLPPIPKYEKKLPTVYDPSAVGSLLGHGDARLNLILSVALQCGLREQELKYLQAPDINHRDGTIRVRGKKEYGFKVKDSEERDVPVPGTLLARLKAWPVDKASQLLFPTQRGKPDGHLLRGLKRAVNEAGLACGRCVGCRGTGECREWTLHRFRRSYLTTLLRNNVDMRTVQAFAGHSDLASTMRYLRPASASEAQAKINSIDWTS